MCKPIFGDIAQIISLIIIYTHYNHDHDGLSRYTHSHKLSLQPSASEALYSARSIPVQAVDCIQIDNLSTREEI